MANGIHPLINVSNLDKSLEWYKSVGLKTRSYEEGGMRWAEVTSGDGSIVVFPKDSPMADEATRAWLSGDLGRGVLLMVAVPKAAPLWAKATAFGAEVDTPIADNPWGGQSFMLRDPDGYVISVSDKWPGPAMKKAKPKKVAKKATRPAKRAKPAKGKASKKTKPAKRRRS